MLVMLNLQVGLLPVVKNKKLNGCWLDMQPERLSQVTAIRLKPYVCVVQPRKHLIREKSP